MFIRVSNRSSVLTLQAELWRKERREREGRGKGEGREEELRLCRRRDFDATHDLVLLISPPSVTRFLAAINVLFSPRLSTTRVTDRSAVCPVLPCDCLAGDGLALGYGTHSSSSRGQIVLGTEPTSPTAGLTASMRLDSASGSAAESTTPGGGGTKSMPTSNLGTAARARPRSRALFEAYAANGLAFSLSMLPHLVGALLAALAAPLDGADDGTEFAAAAHMRRLPSLSARAAADADAGHRCARGLAPEAVSFAWLVALGSALVTHIAACGMLPRVPEQRGSRRVRCSQAIAVKLARASQNRSNTLVESSRYFGNTSRSCRDVARGAQRSRGSRARGSQGLQ
jgi:hypothetical protein